MDCLAFMRYVWKIEPVATMTEDDIVAAIAPTTQRYLDGNIGPATVRGNVATTRARLGLPRPEPIVIFAKAEST
jgi:hypothetical protein